MKNSDISKVKFYVKKIKEMSDAEIRDCAELFSNSYGHYRNDAPQNAGARIRMSVDFFSKRYLYDDVKIAYAKNGRYLVGQAIYIRKNYENVGTMTWVLQLVVAEKYRMCGIGSTLLYSIWGMSNDFAWGLATANPCTVKALENATLRKCDPKYIKKNIEYLKMLAEETGFVKTDSYCVDDNKSVVNTNFFVDNSEYASEYKKIDDWKLGDILRNLKKQYF